LNFAAAFSHFNGTVQHLTGD